MKVKEIKNSKCRDRDVIVLQRCCRALDRSTSKRMLKANLEFLMDRYLIHPIVENHPITNRT